MLARMMRANVETLINVRRLTGKTMNCHEKWSQPPEGNHCRPMAKASTKSGPNTNDGTTLPRLPSAMTT